MSDIFSMIEKKRQEDLRQKAEVDAKRCSEIAKEFMEFFQTKDITVHDARIVLSGMVQTLEYTMARRLDPHRTIEENKTLKDFYAQEISADQKH
jgi:hypothetical protein